MMIALAFASSAAATDAVVHGQWLCRDRGVDIPIRGAKIELHTTGLFGGTVATTTTDENGNYVVADHNGGDHFVRVVLRDSNGVHLNDSLAWWEWYADTGTVNLGRGDNLIGSDELSDGAGNTPVCAVWQGFHDDFNDFVSATGNAPPYGHDLLIRGDFWPTAGVPFTLDTTVQWPGGFQTGASPGDFTVTRHEFGHTIRHAFDGDLPHFLHDVAAFNYLQNHTHCQTTNLGFAFNEGWAEFWSGDTSACHPANPEANQDVEGDVAASLLRLQVHCNDTRADMDRVLQLFPGQIHSFQEYADRINRCVPTPTPATTPMPTVVRSLEYGVSPAVLHYLASRLTATRHEIDTSTQHLHHLLRTIHKLPPCVRKNCDRRLPQVIMPSILRGQIATLKLELNSLRHYSNKKELLNFAHLSEITAIRREQAAINHFNNTVKRIDRTALRGEVRAIHPYLHTRLGRRLRTHLNNTLKLTNRQHITTDLLNLGPPPGTVVRHGKIHSNPPAPKPFGGIFKPERVVTLSCPGKATLGNPITVSGTLSPGLNNAPIKIDYHGAKNTVTHEVQANANGMFTDSFTPNATGTLTIHASYGGDLTYQPSSSPACVTFVGT
jgi:hypothetical protein